MKMAVKNYAPLLYSVWGITFQLSKVANFSTWHAFVAPTIGKSIWISIRSLTSEN